MFPEVKSGPIRSTMPSLFKSADPRLLISVVFTKDNELLLNPPPFLPRKIAGPLLFFME